MNDGGFVVEMASLMILLLIGVVVVFFVYSLFKAVAGYTKKRGQPDENSSEKQPCENSGDSL